MIRESLVLDHEFEDVIQSSEIVVQLCTVIADEPTELISTNRARVSLARVGSTVAFERIPRPIAEVREVHLQSCSSDLLAITHVTGDLSKALQQLEETRHDHLRAHAT